MNQMSLVRIILRNQANNAKLLHLVILVNLMVVVVKGFWVWSYLVITKITCLNVHPVVHFGYQLTGGTS